MSHLEPSLERELQKITYFKTTLLTKLFLLLKNHCKYVNAFGIEEDIN